MIRKFRVQRRIPFRSAFRVAFVLVAILSSGIYFGGISFAASNSTLNQEIQNGAFLADIRDAGGSPVANPSVTMGAVNFSFACQTATGTLGTPTERIRIDNPTAAVNWTVNLAATGGGTSVWLGADNGDTYDYNDASGCTDGADTDTKGGQLTVDPTVSTLTADGSCGCTTTNITPGSATGFVEGVAGDEVNLYSGSSADDFGRWYVEGIGLSQQIPASQTVDTSYTIDMTLTTTSS